MLARRELSVAQVRDRLAARGFHGDAIAGAIGRLQSAGALDDQRVARACARTHVVVKRHGRARVLRELAAIGIPADVCRQALAEVFDSVDERRLIDEAIARRQRRGSSSDDPAGRRRLYAALVRQGFTPAAIRDALGRRDDGDVEE
jgi:SOS response regulatory protein OraA/RecX